MCDAFSFTRFPRKRCFICPECYRYQSYQWNQHWASFQADSSCKLLISSWYRFLDCQPRRKCILLWFKNCRHKSFLFEGLKVKSGLIIISLCSIWTAGLHTYVSCPLCLEQCDFDIKLKKRFTSNIRGPVAWELGFVTWHAVLDIVFLNWLKDGRKVHLL